MTGRLRPQHRLRHRHVDWRARPQPAVEDVVCIGAFLGSFVFLGWLVVQIVIELGRLPW